MELNLKEKLKNFVKTKKSTILDLSVILLLGLLSLTWFRGNNLISGGDFGMPFDWVKYFKGMFYVWIERNSLGAADYRNISSVFPYAAFGALMQSLGFSLVFIEKIFFYFWFVGSGLSMYFLCSVLGMKRLGKLTASVFFMLNPFSLIVIWRVSHGLIQMPYSFAPLVLGLYVYGLKGKRGFKFIILACLLWLFMTGSAYANPRMVVVHWLLIFFYFLSVILYQPQERSFTLKFSLKFLAIWLGLNFYWLFPFVYSMSESLDSAHLPSLMNDIETLKLTSARIIDSIRMFGYWAIHSGYKGDPYHPYEAYYRSSLVMVISWLIPILVLLGFLNKDSRRKPLFFFFIITIIFGIIGMAGPHSPFGGILMTLYKAFPSLALLTRFTFLSFGISTFTLFAVLLGYGFLFIYERGERFFKKLIYLPVFVIIILLSVVLVWPFWTGEVTARAGKVIPGERVKIPSYWWEVKKWFSEQKGFYRILPLPMSQTYNMAYNWEEGYSGGDPIRWISDNPVLFANTGESFKIPALIGKIIEEERDFKEAGKLLGMINVKYVLYRKDVRWDFIAGHDSWFAHTPQKIEKFLKNQEDLKLVETFGPWEVYELNSNEILPHVYVPQKLGLIYGTIERLVDTTQYLHPEKKEGLLFVFQDNEKDLFFPENFFDQIFISQEPLFYEEKTQKLTPFVVYNFTVPQDEEYEIFLHESDIKKYYSLSENSLEAVLDEKKSLKINLQSAGVNQLSLGRLNLKTGQHQLKILLPPSLNLLTDPSFEESRWQGPVDAFPDDSLAANFSVSQSLDAFEGKYSLQIETTGHSPMVYAPIENFQPGETYQLSFAAKHVTGNPPYFAIWENPSKTAVLDMDFSQSRFNKSTPMTMLYLQGTLPKETSWKSYHLVFKPKDSTQRCGVVFVSYQRDLGKTVNLYDAVKVERAFTNPIMLRLVSSSLVNVVPEISFKKKNSGKYEVSVSRAKEPYILIFSESFHPKWKASVEGEHLLMNGFANGWYIKKLGDYKFTIEFGPQKIYYFSIGVSLAALLLSIGYLGYLKIQNSKHKTLTD